MSNNPNDTKDNVVQFPERNSLNVEQNTLPPGVQKLSDGPYRGPSAAVEEALRHTGFDEAALNAGPIEIRIIAEFGSEGCMFHAMNARSVIFQGPPADADESKTDALRETPAPVALPTPAPQSPAGRILRLMAETNGIPVSRYIVAATLSEMTTLDEELAGADHRTLQQVVDGEALVVEAFPESHKILDRLHKEV